MTPALPLPTVPTELLGLRILVLEDDPFCSIVLEDMLTDLGFSVVGPFMELDEAVNFVCNRADEVDVAILDVNIQGERSFGLAEMLLEHEVPFFFSTGYDEAGIDLRWRMWPNIGKLFSETRLLATIAQSYGIPTGAREDENLATNSFVVK